MSTGKKQIYSALVFLAFAVIAFPLAAESEIIKLEAVASFYADDFHGRPTSSGEIFDMNALTAAHKTLPFGTMLEVTNLENGKKAMVRVNDRGPFVENRELDVSKRAAEILGMIDTGTARVSIRKVDSLDAAAISAGATGNSDDSSAVATPARPPAQAITAEVPVGTVQPASLVIPPDTPQSVSAVNKGIQWRIQLGAFSREENATRMAVRLRKDGFNPSFERTDTFTRVILAGIPDEELSGTRYRLNSAGYEGFIVKREIR